MTSIDNVNNLFGSDDSDDLFAETTDSAVFRYLLNHSICDDEDKSDNVKIMPSRHINHRSHEIYINPLIKAIIKRHEALHQSSGRRIQTMIKFLTLYVYGKRNIEKTSITAGMLQDPVKRLVYKRIRKLMSDPGRRQRILEFVHKKDIARRLINFFMVTYVVKDPGVEYWLDCTTSNHKIIGNINEIDNPEALRRKSQGENIILVNLHTAYKDSKQRGGSRNLHAPYRRDDIVRDDHDVEYSLCALNYFLWMDEMGAIEAFYRLEDDIRKKKLIFDKKNHQRRREAKELGKRKKEKLVLGRDTSGHNYRAIAMTYTHKPFANSNMIDDMSDDDAMTLDECFSQVNKRQKV